MSLERVSAICAELPEAEHEIGLAPKRLATLLEP